MSDKQGSAPAQVSGSALGEQWADQEHKKKEREQRRTKGHLGHRIRQFKEGHGEA